MNIISYTDARNNLKSVLDQVIVDATHTVIHRRDAEDAVVMSKSEYDGMMETMHLLASPRNANRLMESLEQLNNGQTVGMSEEEFMAQS